MTTEVDESIPLNLPVPFAVQAPAGRVIIPSSSPTTTLEDFEPSLVTPNPNVECPSDKRNVCGSKTKVGRWTEQEHLVFLDGLKIFGKQWKMIAGMIGTRTVVQVRTHAQKYFMKMDRKGNPAAAVVPNKMPRPVKRKSLPSPSSSARSKSRKASQRLSLPATLGGGAIMIPSLSELEPQALDPSEAPQL
jgi:SHAQKYF class myb-like DNA-binding protein